MKRIYIDLDGVLNKYTGNYEENVIPEPADGAENFLKTLSKNYMLFLFTTRNKELSQNWLKKHNLDKYITEVTNVKEGATVYIDDRAVCFNGCFEETIKQIENFKPWYQ